MNRNNKSIEGILFSTANVMLSHITQFDRDAFLRSRNYYESQLNQAKSEGINLDTRKYRRTEKLYEKAIERARVLEWGCKKKGLKRFNKELCEWWLENKGAEDCLEYIKCKTYLEPITLSCGETIWEIKGGKRR